MRWRKYIAKRSVQKALSFLITLAILVSDFGYGLFLHEYPSIAEAAQVTVDSNVNLTTSAHLQSGSQTVFTDDQTGYKFFVDAGGYCVYRKTTDGGGTWSATTTVDSQTDCISITVWYDKWTPGDTGNIIHIVTMDTSVDDLFYNNLDTGSSDTLLKGSSPVDASTNSGNSVATYGTGANIPTITKGTDGTIYLASADSSDSYVVECSSNCGVATSWTETGTNPMDLANDYSLLVPLAGGNIMLINRDISLEDIRTKIWNNSTWSASWTVVDSDATDNTTYDGGLAATVSSTTPGAIYLAYTANNATLGTDDAVRTAYYDGSIWTAKTAVIANGGATRAITGVTIAVNGSTDDVYVGYSARTTAGTANTGRAYWKKSTDGMTSWGTEQGPMNATGDDIYGFDFNNINSERIFATWYEATEDYIYGDTVEDIFLGVLTGSGGAQTATVNASTSNFYIGGRFALLDTYTSHDVTDITITESGTVDGFTDIANVKLYYELDTSAPYDCASVSYNGTEGQFGSTDVNGFSGADGVSSFTGTTITVSTTTALCVYVVMDVLDSVTNNETIEISIANPTTDIVVTGSIAGPSASQAISGATTVLNDMPIQMHYHWRNDNGSETTATSKTSGVEDTSYTAFQQGTVARLRVEVSNEGGSSTPAMQYRLEYAETTDLCSADTTGWTDVGAAGGHFDMFNSTNLTDGANTTNIAVASGGVTNENTTFLTPNAGVKDTSSQTANITLTTTQYVELEYSITASTTATEGNTYCFRVTNAGTPIFAYNQYPRTNIAADISVTATGTQTTSTNLPATNFYIGGKYVITDNVGTHNVTSVMITENGTVNGQTDLDNIKLYYDLDASAPYDCASESYAGTESQFGSTDTDGFTGENGTSTFTGSVAISTTATMCLYVVLDTTTGAKNGETIDIIMESPSINLGVSGGGSVSPSINRDITGATSLVGAVLTQTHYHWRADNGSETTATSLSGDAEDTPITNVAQTTPVRLRMQVSNEGGITSPSVPFRIEYGTKITTCDAISSWIDVGISGGAWEMYNSTNLTDGGNTTDIAVASGGVTNENTTFLTPNSAIKDTSSQVASTTLSNTQYIEAEYSMRQTIDAGYETTYCFRISNGAYELDAYTRYAELTTSPERDFEIQRKTSNFSTQSLTLVAGVDYTAPSASTSAFVRITNSHYTGAGDSSTGGTQNSDDVTAYISNPSNIMTSFTIQRPATAIATTTRVSWEIIEFIGAPGSDNEMIVRSQTSVTYGTTAIVATGTAVSGITDDSDVVVFITGQLNPDTGTANYNTGQSTSEWYAPTDVPVFRRDNAGTDASIVSYAVVEFKGPNWIVQRNQHTYTAAGTTETESISAVSSLSRTFIHTQKRNAAALTGTDEFGHEVWLSSVGFVSYYLEPGATTPSGQTSVAWIIENIQTSAGEMDVTRSSGNSNGGSEPLTISVPIGKTLSDITNASIFVNTRAAGTGTLYPRPIAGATIASTTHYELWRSDTGASLAYRTEIVEWPTAGLALKQNYYRFYDDNGSLDPSDPWPVGGIDLGENTILTGSDQPLGEGDRIRIRMSLQVNNATFPATTKAFKLQYAPLVTTCSAVEEVSWNDVGLMASSTIWRGYDISGTTDGTPVSGNPPTLSDLNLSVSDVAGTLEEENNSAVNPYTVPENNDVEYDWVVEQNGANAETYYCFRMVESNGTALAGYLQYPQLRTSSFTPRTQNWRWFSDIANVTPTNALAAENTAPINFVNGSSTKLRITVKEVENISRDDVRFKLQYSEYANFETAYDVVATSTCIATSTWCYTNGGGVDNAKIASSTLSDAQSCVAGVGSGCGTHNESPEYKTGFRHNSGTAVEYEFTIQSAAPRVNRVYYFRLYDIIQDIPVTTNTSESYPSLVTEGSSMVFSMQSVATSTVTEGVTVDIASQANTISYGVLPLNNNLESAQRFQVTTNGTEGHQIFMAADGDFISAGGDTIAPITGTNASPLAWNTACDPGAVGCFGYHTGDDTLQGGSTRFAADDTYARLSTTTLEEVAFNSIPVTNESVDVIFRVKIQQLQPAGQYTLRLRYIGVPVF